MNEDLKEFLSLLNKHGVEYVVIGAHALAFHGIARFTEDLDLWLGRSKENARRLAAALEEFGTPFPEGGEHEWTLEKRMVRIGHPPYQLDLLNFAADLPFEQVWERRVPADMGGVPVGILSREDFILSKRAAGRTKDLRDIEELGESV